MRKIAVYCGAAIGNQPAYENGARELGQWMATNNVGLVYGGGQFGLMGIIAKAVLEHSGHVDGIIPENLAARGASFDAISNLKVVKDMTVRKKAMMDMADGFIALPGGPGTIEEISEVFSWSLIGNNSKPCALFNINHYYDHLQSMYDHMVKEGFLADQARQKLLFSDSVDEIIKFMNSYVPPKIREY